MLRDFDALDDRRNDGASVVTRLADRAYEDIRRRILDGALKPGERLGEEQLATLTATSRTPVREALRRLAGEGLVVTGTNGRSRVAEFEPFEADAVFEIRVRLEGFAAELAAVRIGEAAIERLQSICNEIEALGRKVSRRTLTQFLILNNAFHRIVIEEAGSRQLAAAVASALAIPLPLLKHYVWKAPVDIGRSNDQHRELIEAFRRHNPRWAGACMAAHINSTRPVEGVWQPIETSRPAVRKSPDALRAG